MSIKLYGTRFQSKMSEKESPEKEGKAVKVWKCLGNLPAI